MPLEMLDMIVAQVHRLIDGFLYTFLFRLTALLENSRKNNDSIKQVILTQATCVSFVSCITIT